MKKAVPIRHASQIVISEKVTFSYSGQQYTGHIYKKGRKYAYVACDDQRQYRVPYELLLKIPGVPKKQFQYPEEKLRLQFHVNDRVGFEVKQQRQEGTITRLNPKRAHLICDDEKEFQVPYALLTLISSRDPDERTGHKRNGQELREIAEQAEKLLKQHSLGQWSFRFDNASRRAGCCRFDTRVISLAYEYAKFASDVHIEDAILHEIAHALVGKKHNHDAVWQAKANEIGCSAERCHDLQFTPPRYIMRCENHCWVATAERRLRGRICKSCRGKIMYQTYTEERWNKEQSRVAASHHG